MGAGASARVRDGLIEGFKLEKMAHSCEDSFIDDEFDPAVDAALLGPRFMRENPDLLEEDIYWLRPKEFGTGTLYRSGEQALDCTSCLGALDGCNKDLSVVMQAICSRRPDYVRDMIVSYNAIVGCAAIRLFHNGCMEMVVVDDRIPCRLKQPPPPGAPLHQFPFEPISCRLTTGECWLPLIEKALAKLHGSYTSTALGDGCRDLFRDLCGGDHVLDIGLSHMSSLQVSDLFAALYPRYKRNELVIVARKSHSCSRTWAKKQRSNSVFNLVLHDDEESRDRKVTENAFGADISGTKRRKEDQADGFAHTLHHCMDQHGDSVVEHVYASAANTSSQRIPKALFDDVMQQPQMLTTRYDEMQRMEKWDDRKFFVCVSEDEPEIEKVDMQGMTIGDYLRRRIEEAKKYEADRNKNDDELEEDERLAAKREEDIQAAGGPPEPPAHAPYKTYSPEWLSWKQFCEDYEQLVVCVVASEGHCCHASHGIDVNPTVGLTMQSGWDPTVGTSGGGQHLKTWRNSPLFRIKMKEFKACRGRLLITTSLPDARKDAYFMDAIPDLAEWDGNQYHGGKLLYPAHALFVCQDEPTLTNVVVNTDYSQQRDVTVEMDLDLRTNGPFTYVLVPCTYADEIRSDFYITSTFFDEDGNRHQIEIEILEEWTGYNYVANVSGQWLKGKTAMGPCSKHNQFSFLNPAWKIKIAGPQGDDASVESESVLGRSRETGLGGLGMVSTIEEEKEGSSIYAEKSAALKAGSSLLDGPSNLSYDDVDHLNQSSVISVPSNDTGPYSKNRIRRRDDKPSVRYFQICTLLSPSTEMGSRSRGNSPANSRPSTAEHSGGLPDPTSSRLPRSGMYLLTPNAYAKLLHNGGDCGMQAVNDGFLGRFRFNAYPVTARHEKFCIFNGGVNGNNYLHRGSDVYEEIIVMPALNDKGVEGSFKLEIMCNLPFELEMVELGTVPAPLKDIANVRASIMSASRASRLAAKATKMSTAYFASTNNDMAKNGSTRAVSLSNNTCAQNMNREAQLRQGTYEGLSDAPTSGIGMVNMPSFEREVITSTIDATSAYNAEDAQLDTTSMILNTADADQNTSLEQPSLTSTVSGAGSSIVGQMAAVSSMARASLDGLGVAIPPASHGKPPPADPTMIRSMMGTMKKGLAKQIREDTESRLNAISIAMWSNENRLEAAIKKQYEEEKARDEAGIPRDEGTYGGTVYFQPFHDRSGGLIEKGPANP